MEVLKVITHAGMGFEPPPNTKEAFSIAARVPVHAAEGDLRLIKSGDWVFTHKEQMNGRRVEDMSRKEIKAQSAGHWNGRSVEFTFLDEVLPEFSGIHWYLDLKTHSRGAGMRLVDEINALNLGDSVSYTTDNIDVIPEIKNRNPDAQVGFYHISHPPTYGYIPGYRISRAAKAGADFLLPWADSASQDVFSACEDNGLPVVPFFLSTQTLWTPTMSRTLTRVAERGAIGIMTNHVHDVFNLLGQSTAEPLEQAA